MNLTIIDVLRARATITPEQTVFTFLGDEEREEGRLSFAELHRAAGTAAGALQRLCNQGDRVLLVSQPGIEQIVAFFGCMYAGVIAVPSPAPSGEEEGTRLWAIVNDCRPSAVLSTTVGLGRTRAVLESSCPQCIDFATLGQDSGDQFEPAITPTTTAFLQYTSGSTAVPKGVIVAHAAIMANEEMIRESFEQSERSIIVSWLPFYHDMGLIGTILQPVYTGSSCIFMAPDAFLQRPARWLRAISRYRATTSGGPDFAYRLCASKAAEIGREQLDLGSWAVAFNGAEPVRPTTMDMFSRAFESHGFRRAAFRPCYGLAEATLLVTAARKEESVDVASASLRHHRVVEVDPGSADARRVVSCGTPAGTAEVIIVDPTRNAVVKPGSVGEIWTAGPQVGPGYFNQADGTRRTFACRTAGARERRYLRTGDLGFILRGNLYVTGRTKELIIIRGENHYPEDIEQSVSRAMDGGGNRLCAAFSIDDNDERVVVVQEVARGTEAGNFEQAAAAARHAVARDHGVQLYGIVFVKQRSLPRTSSGKLQRRACRDRFNRMKLAVVATHMFEDPTQVHRFDLLAIAVRSASNRTLRTAAIEKYVQARIAASLHVSVDRIDCASALGTFGLDSLAAAELASCIERDLDAIVRASDITPSTTVRTIAAMVDHGLNESAPVRPVERLDADTAPLSFEQERLWLVDQLYPWTQSSLGAAISIAGKASETVVRKAVADLHARHDCLRTVFVSTPDGLRQRVLASRQVEIHIDEMTLSAEEIEKPNWSQVALRRMLDSTRYDIAHGPCVRFRLLRGRGNVVLLIAAHHLVMDVASVGIIARDLAALCDTTDASGEVHAPACRCIDIATAERAAGGVSTGDLAYWKAKLARRTTAIWWPDRRCGSSATSIVRSVTIEPNAADALRMESASDATLFDRVLGAFAICTSRLLGADDLLVAVAMSRRFRAVEQDVVGPLSQPMFVRISTGVGPDVTFRDFAATADHEVREARQRSEPPFAEIMKLASQELGDCSTLPILISWLPKSLRERRGDLAVSVESIDGSVAGVDLLVLVQTDDAGLHIELRADADAHSEATIARLSESLVTTLEHAAVRPTITVAELLQELEPVIVDTRPPHDVVVAASFTAAPIADVLRFWGGPLGTALRPAFAASPPVRQLLDSESDFASNRNGSNVVIVRASDLIDHTAGEADARTCAVQFADAVRASASRTGTLHIVCFVPSHDGLASVANRKWEHDIQDQLRGAPHVAVLTTDDIASMYPVEAWHDPEAEALGDVPLTPSYFASVGTAIARTIYGAQVAKPKLIAVDCDDTLWTGLCADGPRNVSCDAGRMALQQFLVDRHDDGVLLAICSKNHIADVEQVFTARDDMPLRLSHFAVRKVGWNAKSESLLAIANETGCAFDSIVFLDNNPVECAEVLAHCPGVKVFQLPEESAQVGAFGPRLWALDRRPTTYEDRARNELFKRERVRLASAKGAPSFAAYLRSLNIEVTISPLTTSDLARASQLTVRTTQFNSTGQRRGEAELSEWLQRSSRECVTVRAKDRFGDYGIVGLVFHELARDCLVIDQIVLSCRALGRSIEEHLVGWLGYRALDNGLHRLRFAHRVTSRNEPVERFLRSICLDGSIHAEEMVFEVASEDAIHCLANAEKRWERQGPASDGVRGSSSAAPSRSDPSPKPIWP